MKHPTKRIISWGLLLCVSVLAIYFVLLAGNPNDLEGKFSSYQFFPHDKSDVLQFENGLVTVKTCCGNGYQGDYQKDGDSWTWYYQEILRKSPPEFKFKEPVKIRVEPHIFSVTLTFEDGQTLTLPRRVFTSIPL